jgi:hypothetical protein
MARFAPKTAGGPGGVPAAEVEALRIEFWRGTRWRVLARDPGRRGELPDEFFRALFAPVDREAEELLLGPRGRGSEEG